MNLDRFIKMKLCQEVFFLESSDMCEKGNNVKFFLEYFLFILCYCIWKASKAQKEYFEITTCIVQSPIFLNFDKISLGISQ